MSEASEPLARLMSEASNAHVALVAKGDDLVADLGLSSAREQLLAALSAAGTPRTVSQLARTLSLSRQAVQRVADDLVKGGLCAYFANPDHARAKLLAPTEAGGLAHAEAKRRKALWVEELAQGLPAAGLEIATELLRLVVRRASRSGSRKA